MNSPRSIVIVLALLLVGASSLTAQELTRRGGGYQAVFDKRFDMAPGGELVVRLVSGQVTIVAGEGKGLTVRHELRIDAYTEAEARGARDAAQNSYRHSAERLTINQEAAPGWIDQRLDIRLPAEFNLTVRLSQGDIRVQSVRGILNLTTGRGDIHLQDTDGESDIRSSAGDLTLRNAMGRIEGMTSGGDIDVLDAGESLRLKTSGGNIRIENAQTVNVATSGGRIRLRNISREVEARTSGGDISAVQCLGPAQLRTSGGDIEVENMPDGVKAVTSGGDIRGINLGGSVLVQTRGGDIDLRGIAGQVNAETSAGRIRLELTLADFSIPHRITLETASGDIELWIPERLPATIEAEIHTAGGRWNRFDIHSDFPLTREVSGDGQVIRKTGDINGGGDRIILDCYHGDIFIRKR